MDPQTPLPKNASAAEQRQYEAAERNREATNTAVLAAAIVCGLASLREVVGGLVERLGEDRSESFRRSLENELGVLWRSVAITDDALKVSPVGLHIWLVPRWHWRYPPEMLISRKQATFRRRLPTPSLWRPAKLRHIDHVDPSYMKWRRGRGVVGQCWLQRGRVQLDVEKDWKQFESVSASEWKAASRNDNVTNLTMQLTFGQFQRLRKLYSEVLAVPIYKERASGTRYFVGCVVADMPALKPGQQRRMSILTPQFETRLRRTAADVGRHIKV